MIVVNMIVMPGIVNLKEPKHHVISMDKMNISVLLVIIMVVVNLILLPGIVKLKEPKHHVVGIKMKIFVTNQKQVVNMKKLIPRMVSANLKEP